MKRETRTQDMLRVASLKKRWEKSKHVINDKCTRMRIIPRRPAVDDERDVSHADARDCVARPSPTQEIGVLALAVTHTQLESRLKPPTCPTPQTFSKVMFCT